MCFKKTFAGTKEAGRASTITPRISACTWPVWAAILLAVVLCCAGPIRAQVAYQRYATNFVEVGSSQPAAIVADSLGDSAYSLYGPGGNAFVTGQACVNAGCTDQEAVTIKYDPIGNLLWKAWLKSPVGVAKGVDIGIDAASNSYVLFLLWQKRDSSNQLTDPDVVTAKYNADGVRQWINYLSSTSAVTRTPVKLSVSPSGDVYVTTVASNIAVNTKSDVLTIKYDTTGKTVWAQVAPPASNPLSVPIGIQQDAQEDVYVLVKSSAPSGGPVSSLILKYASDGTLAKSFGSEQIGDPVAFQVSPAGNSYAVGFAPTITAGDTGNVTLAKFNPDGTLAWSNNLGSTTESPKSPQPVALALDPKEDVFLGSTATGTAAACGGSVATSFVATKFDTGGTQQWSSTYADSGSADTPTAIVANSLGNLYVTGKSEFSSGSTCVPQILTVKFGLPGTVIWTERYSADPAGDSPAGIAIGGQGGLFIAGTGAPTQTDADWVTLDYVQDGSKLSTSSLEFVAFPEQPQQATVSIINISEEPLIVIGFNGSYGSFGFDLGSCAGVPIPIGGSCQVTIEFGGGFTNGGFMQVADNWEASLLQITPQLSVFGIVIGQ
jgi:hypothetical protein